MNFPLKLALLVLIIFGLLTTGMVLWKPIKVKYYTSLLRSGNMAERQVAARKLLEMKLKDPVFNFYSDRYTSPDVEMRIDVMEELCNVDVEMMKEIFRNRVYSEQVRIPAGTLMMLSNDRKVNIKSLYVDKFEVTNEKLRVFYRYMCSVKEYKIFQSESCFLEEPVIPEWAQTDFNINAANLPATKVSTDDEKAYTEWLDMRLPTHQEWQYMALAGSTGKYFFGDNENLLDNYAWFKDNSGGKYHPVGLKKPNKWGLYDVYGNVWETAIMSTSITKNSYTIMGGSYNNMPMETSPKEDWGDIKKNSVGFRCVRDAK